MNKSLKILTEAFANVTFKLMLMTTDIMLNMTIRSTINAIKKGLDPSTMFHNVMKVIKIEGTLIALAGLGRFAIGKNIITYSSVKVIDGVITPIVDVWVDDLGSSISFASITELNEEQEEIFFKAVRLKEDSVVMSNGPLKYKEDFEIESYRGLEILGFLKDNGTFIVDQENGTDKLEDEYISDVPYVERVYQITPTMETQVAYKAFPVYAIRPEGTQMKDKDNHLWQVTTATKMVCINMNKNGDIDKPTAVDLGQFDATYMDWNEYFSSKECVA